MLNSFTLNGPPPLTYQNLFRTALVAALGANATLASIVGTLIVPVVVPRNAPGPSLTYEVRSVRREQNLDGPNGVANAAVRYTCRSGFESDVDTMREALRNLFDGSSNALGSIEVLGVFSRDEEDQYAQPGDASDAGTFEQRFTLTYRYREPKPSLS